MKFTKQKRRNGLTLLELVIVLTILVAVGGIMVAIFPQFLTKAHTSTCAANIPEMIKAVQMYDGMYTEGYPDRMDSLVVGTQHASFLADDHGLGTVTLTQEQADALNEAGIGEVMTMADDPGTGDWWHPTFHPYGNEVLSDTDYATVTAGMTMATLDANYTTNPINAQTMGLDPGKVYVVLGLGAPCRMFGKTANEAPVHFADDMNDNPNKRYMRFAAIFQIGDDVGENGDDDTWGTADDIPPTTLSKARFRTVGALHTGGMEGVAAHTQAYWDDHEDANH